MLKITDDTSYWYYLNTTQNNCYSYLMHWFLEWRCSSHLLESNWAKSIWQVENRLVSRRLNLVTHFSSSFPSKSWRASKYKIQYNVFYYMILASFYMVWNENGITRYVKFKEILYFFRVHATLPFTRATPKTPSTLDDIFLNDGRRIIIFDWLTTFKVQY